MGEIRRIPVTVDTRAEAGQTNVYLIGKDPAILVDPAARTAALDDAIGEVGVGKILVTHTHRDHVGGIQAYTPGATVYARAGRVQRFSRVTAIEPDATLRDGDTVMAGDGTRVRVMELPGHAPDHLGFIVDTGMLTGDLLIHEGSVVVGPPDGDLRAYFTSLRRAYAIDPARIYPGHGPVLDRPREELMRILEHRYHRERRIEAAVTAGARTPEEIVTRTYDKDLTGIRDLARATVVGHLEKLDVEGTIEWNGARATPRRC